MQTRRIALAAASVTVLQNGRPVLVGGRTDEGGEYSVRLPAGKYEVSVSALRYERKQADPTPIGPPWRSGPLTTVPHIRLLVTVGFSGMIVPCDGRCGFPSIATAVLALP